MQNSQPVVAHCNSNIITSFTMDWYEDQDDFSVGALSHEGEFLEIDFFYEDCNLEEAGQHFDIYVGIYNDPIRGTILCDWSIDEDGNVEIELLPFHKHCPSIAEWMETAAFLMEA